MTGKESTHMDRHTRATHEEVVEIIASIWLQFVIRMDPSFLKKKKKSIYIGLMGWINSFIIIILHRSIASGRVPPHD